LYTHPSVGGCMVKRFSEVSSRFSIRDVDQKLLDQSSWPRADENALSPKDQELFIQRCNAVKAYIDLDLFSESDPIPKREALRLLRKCIKIHPDNRVYGFRALIPYYRIKRYTRKTPLKSDITEVHGRSGAFTALLIQHPSLADLIEREVFKKGRKVNESIISIKALHGKFIKACTELGLEFSNAYPFDRVTRGYA
jgi:putative transposase